MKAIVIHHYGPPDVLTYQDVPDPVPRDGEIRIRIHAATVNRVLDVSLRAGKEGARGAVLPLIPGVDCAGIVDAVGRGVTRWRKGMRVAAAGIMPLPGRRSEMPRRGRRRQDQGTDRAHPAAVAGGRGASPGRIGRVDGQDRARPDAGIAPLPGRDGSPIFQLFPSSPMTPGFASEGGEAQRRLNPWPQRR